MAPILIDRSGIFAHLLRRSTHLLALALFCSVGQGISSVWVIAQISHAIASANDQKKWYLTAAVAVMAFHMMSGVTFARLSQRVQATAREYICSVTMKAKYIHLEKIGAARIQAALTDHGARVGDLFLSLPMILTNGVIVVGCLAYMAFLSASIFGIAAVAMLLGIGSYYIALLHSLKHLDRASAHQDELFRSFNSMIAGAKELRLNGLRAQRFGEQVWTEIREVRRERTIGLSIFAMTGSWGNFLIFAFIGLVLFALADHGVDRVNVTAGFSLIFVYMIFPLQALLTNLPQISLARTSARRINGLADEMDFEYTESASSVPAQHGLLFEHTLTLESLTFSHVQTGTNAALSVGPLDMTFRRGELTFLVGGNGSGKTTIAKLISGLYAPDAGQILVDGRPVRETGRAAYRENFSAVFSDYHLFESLLQINGPEYDARANALLGNLGLLHKVNVRGGSFSTIALSQGERKRLAMVVALLEDRPAYIFDEWAADQDPSFKGVFYREILPDLRDRGKLVIVISHDDRYFDAADQIVWIENGRVDRYRINEPENSRLAVTTD